MNAVVFIPLTQGKVAVIDFEDFEKVRSFKWYAERGRNTWYARGRNSASSPRTVAMHNVLLSEACHPIDHIDGDGLNNTRANLRPASCRENARNQRKRKNCSSQYMGVCWANNRQKWQAQIKISSKENLFLGLFDSEIEAAKARDAATKKYFGEFGRLNFP